MGGRVEHVPDIHMGPASSGCMCERRVEHVPDIHMGPASSGCMCERRVEHVPRMTVSGPPRTPRDTLARRRLRHREPRPGSWHVT